jgi:hypothetical protein
VERQCKFLKPVTHRIKEATCVALMLKADHQIPIAATALTVVNFQQI